MSCDICGRTIGHASGCPNFSPPKVAHYCSICGQGIYGGEEYIENCNGVCRHFECFKGLKELLDWLGYEVKVMEEGYE